MNAMLEAFPGAQWALFRKFNFGGRSSTTP
jgi:hypothetical protein